MGEPELNLTKQQLRSRTACQSVIWVCCEEKSCSSPASFAPRHFSVEHGFTVDNVNVISVNLSSLLLLMFSSHWRPNLMTCLGHRLRLTPSISTVRMAHARMTSNEHQSAQFNVCIKKWYITSLHTSIRARLIEQLTREIQVLKDELESFRLEVKHPQTNFSWSTREHNLTWPLASLWWLSERSDLQGLEGPCQWVRSRACRTEPPEAAGCRWEWVPEGRAGRAAQG